LSAASERTRGDLGDLVLTARNSEIDSAGLDSVEDRPDHVWKAEGIMHLWVHGAGNRLQISFLSSSYHDRLSRRARPGDIVFGVKCGLDKGHTT